MTPDIEACETDIAPDFLPSFDEAAGDVPTDARLGEPVVARPGRWTGA